MRIAPAVIATVATLGITGCGGGSNSSGAGPSQPSSIDVTVTLRDQGSLDLLFNKGGGVCTSVNFADTLGGGTPAPIRVELRDASGKLVGTTRLPKTGGTFNRAKGCTWPVTFHDIPSGKLFSAKVTDGTNEFDGSGPAANVSISF